MSTPAWILTCLLLFLFNMAFFNNAFGYSPAMVKSTIELKKKLAAESVYSRRLRLVDDYRDKSLDLLASYQDESERPSLSKDRKSDLDAFIFDGFDIYNSLSQYPQFNGRGSRAQVVCTTINDIGQTVKNPSGMQRPEPTGGLRSGKFEADIIARLLNQCK